MRWDGRKQQHVRWGGEGKVAGTSPGNLEIPLHVGKAAFDVWL